MKLYIQLDPFTSATVDLIINDQGSRREPTLAETLETVHALGSALLIDTPGSRVSLTEAEIATLVDKGIALHAAIETNKSRLKAISEQLQAHALTVPSQHIKLVDEDREGTRYLAHGSDDKIVPVVCASDLIMQTLADDSEELALVAMTAREKFPQFYKRVVAYVSTFSKSNKFDGKKFRAAARTELPDPEAFISACLRRNRDGIPISAIKVEWSD